MLKITKKNYNIGYKYYESVRNIDILDNVHEIKPLDFNSVLNVKPQLITYTTQINSVLLKIMYKHIHDCVFLILLYTDKITLERKIKIESSFPLNTLIDRLINYANSSVLLSSTQFINMYKYFLTT